MTCLSGFAFYQLFTFSPFPQDLILYESGDGLRAGGSTATSVVQGLGGGRGRLPHAVCGRAWSSEDLAKWPQLGHVVSMEEFQPGESPAAG